MSVASHRIKQFFEPLGNVLRHLREPTTSLLRVFCAAMISLSFGLSATAQQVDTTPPELTSFAISVVYANVTVVSIAATATDNFSGVSHAAYYITSPSGSQLSSYAGVESGTTAATLGDTLSLGATPLLGNYTLNKICVFDIRSNSKCFSGSALAALGSPTFVTVGGTNDSIAPTITGFAFNPSTQNIASVAGNLNATVQFTDNASGVAKIEYSLIRPNGSVSQHSSTNISAGLPKSGSMQFNWPLPVSSPTGTYTLSKLCATDVAGNKKCYESTALLALNPANSALVTAITSIPFNYSATSVGIVTIEEKDQPIPVFSVTKTASGNPFIGGKTGQFYTINIAVQNGKVSSPILLLDKLANGISTSGPVTAVGASISGCPAAGATDLAGCTLTASANSSNIVVTVPVSVAPSAVSGANTATVKGGGSTLCTGIAPACTGSTGPVAIARLIDAVDDAVSQPAYYAWSFNVATNDSFPPGSIFTYLSAGSTCLAASVSATGVAYYAAPALNSAALTCVIQYQVCAPVASQAGCDSANLRVTAYAVTAVPDAISATPNTVGNTDVAANDTYPAGAQFSLVASGTTCMNAQVSSTGVAGFTSPASGSSCAVKYKLCAPSPYQNACSVGNLNVTGFNPGCSSLSLTYQAVVPANSPIVAFTTSGNGCSFIAPNSFQLAGDYKLAGSVVTSSSSVPQVMPTATFTLAAKGLLKGKAVYDAATGKFKLVHIP